MISLLLNEINYKINANFKENFKNYQYTLKNSKLIILCSR